MDWRGIKLASIMLVGAVIGQGCGYTMRQDRSQTILRELGIRKIYLEPFQNLTFKGGVENVVFNAFQKRIASLGRVKVVQSREDADAILSGIVTDASYGQAKARNTANIGPFFSKVNEDVNKRECDWIQDPIRGRVQRDPASCGVVQYNFGRRDVEVAETYNASLSCDFQLARREAHKGGTPIPLWSFSPSRRKTYLSSVQLGPAGTTSHLINESEFERALGDLAEEMMLEVNEVLFARF